MSAASRKLIEYLGVLPTGLPVPTDRLAPSPEFLDYYQRRGIAYRKWQYLVIYRFLSNYNCRKWLVARFGDRHEQESFAAWARKYGAEVVTTTIDPSPYKEDNNEAKESDRESATSLRKIMARASTESDGTNVEVNVLGVSGIERILFPAEDYSGFDQD